jgi:hypothetical protein
MAGCSPGTFRLRICAEAFESDGNESEEDVETKECRTRQRLRMRMARRKRGSEWIDDDLSPSPHLDFGTDPGQPVTTTPKNE